MKVTLAAVLLLDVACLAQTGNVLPNPAAKPLDSDPWRREVQSVSQSRMPSSTPQGPSGAQPTPGQVLRLGVKDAEALALKNNPQITNARLNALAAHQVTRQARSNLWPEAYANLTGVDAAENSRISAGSLNNPIIYERAAYGATVRQLITDFGHTTNLVASTRLQEKAEDQNALATKEQILLATDQAFYGVLQARAVLQVAKQTVDSRQLLSDQVTALAKSKLKSELDVSFANVNLAQAKLLLLDAQNNEQSALAALSAILGYPTLRSFDLVDETSPMNAPTPNVDHLIAEALTQRPEVLSATFEYESEQKLHLADRDLLLPAISALGAVGQAPVRNDHLSSWYGAVGVNVQIPVFNGFLYPAKAKESDLRAMAAQQRLMDLRNRISRDVRTSWLNANVSYQRLSVTRQLLDQANLALDLAQTRYKLGLGSIVELSQAQLQQTQAQISNAQAGYDYRLAQAALRYQTTGI
jgi:outer membrane protein